MTAAQVSDELGPVDEPEHLADFRDRLLARDAALEDILPTPGYARGYQGGVDAVIARLVPVGVDYCTEHHGVRNEDEHFCDLHEDKQNECPRCDGGGCIDLDDGGVDECPDCEGGCYTVCAMASLYRTAEEDQ